jgi:serine/threonine protein kinase
MIWSQLDHPRVLTFHGVNRIAYENTLNDPRDYLPISLVSSWMDHGNVLQFLRQEGNLTTETMNRLVSLPNLSWFLQVLSPNPSQLMEISHGLAYLHGCNVVHGDLRGVSAYINHQGCSLTQIHRLIYSSTRTVMFAWLTSVWPLSLNKRLQGPLPRTQRGPCDSWHRKCIYLRNSD